MADLILTCTRRDRPAAADRVRRVALRLAPPEVPVREPLMLESAGVAVAVANPTTEGVWVHGGDGTHADEPVARPDAPAGGACCVGGLFGRPGSWWRTGSEAPEGTYALIRWDADAVDLVADICASRTLWYVLTDDAFLASTSQRALVMLLGGFELQPEATACFLSSGTLGPEVSWDARLCRVQPGVRIALDRASWRLSERRPPYVLEPAAGDTDEHVARLREAIATTCGHLNIDPERWVLALSGGRDSRALLAFLVHNGMRPRCVTWTTRASLRNPLSDVSIARRLARRYRVEHEVLIIDASSDTDAMLARFVAADEGRNDEIVGYLDGLALWRDLARAGVWGILRGDEAYGPRRHSPTPENSRMGLGGAAAADYPESHVIRRLGLAPQSWPAHLHVAQGESRLDYRLRAMQTGYIPIVPAGLNGLKARYLEIITPHLAPRIIETVRSLPAGLRAHSRAFTIIADGVARPIPYARSSSTPSPSEMLKSAEMLEAIVRELTSPGIERVLPGDGALYLLAALATPGGSRPTPKARLKSATKTALSALPSDLVYRLLPPWKGPDSLSPAKLAFRALLANQTIALLEEDASELEKETPSAVGLGGPARA